MNKELVLAMLGIGNIALFNLNNWLFAGDAFLYLLAYGMWLVFAAWSAWYFVSAGLKKKLHIR